MSKNGKTKYNPAWYSEDLDDDDDLDIEASPSSNDYLGSAGSDGIKKSSKSAGGLGDWGESLRSSSTIGGSSTSPRLVIGIDYGTTYTGIAWAQVRTANSLKYSDVTVFQSWPPNKNNPKVPSAYSYADSENGNLQWGYDIDENCHALRWTKMELEPLGPAQELDKLEKLVEGLELIRKIQIDEDYAMTNGVPQHLTKDAEDVVRDFLGDVAREVYSNIKDKTKHLTENVKVELAITHPANWSYEAKNKTFRAVLGSFTKQMFPNLQNVYLMTEPEACALDTVQDMLYKKHDTKLIPGEPFILCDAGGGTVDIVSFRLESISPLKLTKIGSVTGGKCGAILIDQAFIRWLESRVDNLDMMASELAGGHYVLSPMGRAILDRFEAKKRTFDGTGGANIQLPTTADIRREFEQEMDENSAVLTKEDIESLFSQSVEGTLKLILRQITQVQNMSAGQGYSKVKNIFMSGGFSESPYLFKRVTELGRKRGGILVHRAENCWSGVVRGAVLRCAGVGMEAPLASQACPRHYGLCVSESYAEYKHSDNEAVKDQFHGRKIVPEQLIWIVKKGDLILPDEPLKRKFGLACKFSYSQITNNEKVRLTFVGTESEEPPTRLRGLPKDRDVVMFLDLRLGSIPEKALKTERKAGLMGALQFYYKVDMDAEIEITDKVVVKLKCGGKTLITKEMSLDGPTR